MALTLATLLGIDAAVNRRRDPRKLCPAQLIRTPREALRRDDAAHPQSRVALERTLGHCLKDSYQRKASKHSRHRITTPNTPAFRLQPPIVRKATHNERQEALKYRQNIAA